VNIGFHFLVKTAQIILRVFGTVKAAAVFKFGKFRPYIGRLAVSNPRIWVTNPKFGVIRVK